MKTPALFLLEQGHWEEVYGPVKRKRLEALIQTPLIFHSGKSISIAANSYTAIGKSMSKADESLLIVYGAWVARAHTKWERAYCQLLAYCLVHDSV
jgi:hypothetical protein